MWIALKAFSVSPIKEPDSKPSTLILLKKRRLQVHNLFIPHNMILKSCLNMIGPLTTLMETATSNIQNTGI